MGDPQQRLVVSVRRSMTKLSLAAQRLRNLLLQLLDLGETPLPLIREHHRTLYPNDEYPAPSWSQGHLAELSVECAQQFLGHPGGAQQEAAPAAVLDLDSRSSRHGSGPVIRIRHHYIACAARITAAVGSPLYLLEGGPGSARSQAAMQGLIKKKTGSPDKKARLDESTEARSVG